MDVDTNTQLTETQVDAFVANNGYITTDSDTLASLGCTQGQVAKSNGSSWSCAADVDTNTQLTETQVDAMVANNGYMTSDSDTLAALSCLPGEIARFYGPTGTWVCDSETVTTTLPWSAISGIPADIADGDQDTVTTTLPWSSICLLYTSPSPRDLSTSRMPSSA